MPLRKVNFQIAPLQVAYSNDIPLQFVALDTLTHQSNPMYLKHYRNDIAISYAAADNLPFPNETSGWMDNLLKHLQWYVRRELKGADYQLWSPEAIGGHQVIPDERLAQLQNSATIVLLLSKTYLQTPHYQAELNAILNHVPVSSQRLFVVELNQVIRPEPLRAMRG